MLSAIPEFITTTVSIAVAKLAQPATVVSKQVMIRYTKYQDKCNFAEQCHLYKVNAYNCEHEQESSHYCGFYRLLKQFNYKRETNGECECCV